MLGLNKKVFRLSEDFPLRTVIEGDLIVSGFGRERVLRIDYNLSNEAVLISRVQTDSEGIVRRTIELEDYYPKSLNATNIEVIYRGQGGYDKYDEILGENET